MVLFRSIADIAAALKASDPQTDDIYQIAKNCRTSVEMIEEFYAAHIKNTLDTAAINVLRPKPAHRLCCRGAPGSNI